MTMLLNQRRTRQPQYPVGVDWGNPLTCGLEFLWSGTSPTTELIQRRQGYVLALDSLPMRESSSAGVSARGGGGAARRRVFWPGATYKSSTNYTVACFCMQEGSGGNPFDADEIGVVRFFQMGYSSGAQFIPFNTGGTPFGPNNMAVASYRAQMFVGRVRDNEASSWLDGVSGTPLTITGTPQGTSATSVFSIGAFAYNAGGAAYNQGFDGKIYLCAYWARALSDAEIKSLSDNPWQLFSPAVS